MRASDLHSLVWLSRWYGGREERLAKLHEHHLHNIVRLALAECADGSQMRDEVSVEIAGFSVSLSLSSSQVSIVSITPPAVLNGQQLDLFCERYDELDGDSWPCETNDEDVSKIVEHTLKEVVRSEVVVG